VAIDCRPVVRRLVHIRQVMAVTGAMMAVLVFASVSALASSTTQVKIGDNFFAVKRLTVGDGTRVVWRWTGVLNHNVTVQNGPVRFHSRTQAVGTFSHVFSRPGTYTLYCTIHKYMKMTVVVR
jgi:plastocyanin